MTGAAAPAATRWAGLLLAAYFVCSLLGLATGRVLFPCLALGLLVAVVWLPALTRGRARAWVAFVVVQALVLGIAVAGMADLLVELVPFLINVGLAWLFACTLAGRRPLIAHCIAAMEGEARLAEPGVARYARQLTLFWALLLAANALAIALLLVFADRDGILARAGVAAGPRLDAWWSGLWLHAGGYLVLAAAFVLEYGYRRWHLRGIPQLSLPQTLVRLVRSWPRLVRDVVAAR